MPSTELTWASDHRSAYETLTTVVSGSLAHRSEPLEILEAGCGRGWVLGDLGAPVRLTGVDLDEEALRLRVEERGDLDVAIRGDLMTVAVNESSYDLVFSSYVLEHLEQPDIALDRFFSWLRPGGLCAVIIPDKDTAKGFATRMSPFFVHVWYYRWVKGRKTAGKPGFEPYRTFYKDVVGRRGLEDYCASRGHRVVSEIAITMDRADEGMLTMAACRMIKWLTLGRRRDDYCNLVVVIEK
jgi:SAM-dependent methyltransferase